MLPATLVPGDSIPLQFVIHDSDGERYEASFNFLGPKH